jgi:hypothetical protein
MQPQGPLPEENMFVAMQRDNLSPPRVTTTMNIGRGQATGTRSRKRQRLQQMEHMPNVVEQQGEEEGVSVLVEQEAREEQREEEGCVATIRMQEVLNSCSLEMASSHMLHLKN